MRLLLEPLLSYRNGWYEYDANDGMPTDTKAAANPDEVAAAEADWQIEVPTPSKANDDSSDSESEDGSDNIEDSNTNGAVWRRRGTQNPLSNQMGKLQQRLHSIESARSKHIDIVHHMVRERVARGEVDFEYIATGDMIADVLTEPLSQTAHQKCIAGIGLVDL
jgi:hypothetical protein